MSDEYIQLVVGDMEDDRNQLFQCCHIGMVFYTPEQIEDYRQMQFELSLNGDSDGPVNCKGVVVDSLYVEEREMYKTFLLYTDIDDSTRSRLRKISSEKELRCPFCQRS
jgi:hypothetical protein